MNLSLYRLLFHISLLIICLPFAALSQASFEGQVLDKSTEAPIPFATVTLAKSRAATRTNDQGYFHLATATVSNKDSLIFTCIGYQIYRMPILAYKRGVFISLQPVSTNLKEVTIAKGKRKIKTLGAFTTDHLNETRWRLFLRSPQELLRAQMYAKLFKIPKRDALVTEINLGRQESAGGVQDVRMGKNTKFKIHIMSVNPVSGAPDSILFTKEILLTDRSRRVTVRLESMYVAVDADKFFVAVEWLRIPYNEYILNTSYITNSGDVNSLVQSGYDRVLYQPVLARYSWSPNAESWQMTDGVWKILDHPKFEFALSATVKY